MTTTSGDTNNWREKYLNALDDQEQLEKKFAEQQAVLRSALVRVSVAADGQDEALDQIMARLRERLRGDISATDMSNILTQLESAVLAFEQHREQDVLDVRQALMDTTKPLQQFDLSRRVKKDLSEYIALLPERAQKIRLYPALLQQLAQIQQRALAEIEQPKTGLLDKIFGKSTARQDETATEGNQISNGEENTGSAQSPVSVALEAPAPETHFTADYAAQLAQVLHRFFTSLENESEIKPKVERVRQKLGQGIDPHTLIPLLDCVRDLVMEAYLISNHAFAKYLKNVNQELAEIYMLLGGAVKHTQVEREASRKLQNDVIRGMESLESTADSATDINQLKDHVKSQLGNIRQVLDHYQQTDQAQQALAEQLQTLGAKIRMMEEEAEKNRSTLESHRQKALRDSLTGLPNREAYNERAKVEVQRWQRYGRSLTIAIFDIDYFKNINDTYGHQAGDRVIKVIGRSIASRLREVDFFCRYGGEEFVALMPETESATALGVLDKVREAIASTAFNYKDQPMTITLSVGITDFKTGDTLESAFERADQALYTAKASGRNRCYLS
jgi:diguanylate cyclase